MGCFSRISYGVTAENVAEKFQITREQQDNFAVNSHEKALKAQRENKFKEEIINFKKLNQKKLKSILIKMNTLEKA